MCRFGPSHRSLARNHGLVSFDGHLTEGVDLMTFRRRDITNQQVKIFFRLIHSSLIKENAFPLSKDEAWLRKTVYEADHRKSL
jgi:hypothetical protein